VRERVYPEVENLIDYGEDDYWVAFLSRRSSRLGGDLSQSEAIRGRRD
jgi:hypothetical protein